LDIESITKGIDLVSTTISALKTLKDLIPSKKEKIDVEEKLAEAEKNLKIAEAEIAKGFDYKICRRHFPPGILLDLDEFELKCNTCGHIENCE
jgi:hypothetical protein